VLFRSFCSTMLNFLVLPNAFLLLQTGSTRRRPWRSQIFSNGANESERLKKAMSSLYKDRDLAEVMRLHQEFETQILPPSDSSETNNIVSFHDWIEDLLLKTPPPLLMKKAKAIRAIASDVDGTLVSSRTMTVHPSTRLAFTRAIQDPNLIFFLATGKSRLGAFNILGSQIMTIPGVYLQGLYCVDGNGNVVKECKLSNEAIAAAEDIATQYNVSIVGYDGNDLFTTNLTPTVMHLSNHYGEPMPKLLLHPNNKNDTSITNTTTTRMLSSHEPGMHKILFMDDNVTKLELLRPILEHLGNTYYNASVTQALSTMLEWIPAGQSKGKGVAAVCSALNIDPKMELLALGDAENDVDMLEMAAIGVAMGNASPSAKRAADYVMDQHCDNGAAGDAMDLFYFKSH